MKSFSRFARAHLISLNKLVHCKFLTQNSAHDELGWLNETFLWFSQNLTSYVLKKAEGLWSSVVRRCSVKKVFLNISHNSQKKTSVSESRF